MKIDFGDKKLPPRFWSKVDVDQDGHWLWSAAVTSDGYGRYWLGRGQTTLAHRAAYITLVGPVPDDLVIDHLCRIVGCVNPEHLEPVTTLVNIRRAAPFRPATAPVLPDCGAPSAPAYRRGCRCVGCRAANARKKADYKARRVRGEVRPVGPKLRQGFTCDSPSHYTYSHRGCRCDGCRDASALYYRELRRRRRLQAA